MRVLPQYEVIGPPGAPLVAVLGGISASRHVVSTEHDSSPGWWEQIVGPDRAIDTTRLRVLGVDYLDGGRGSDGRPRRTVSTHDQAAAIVNVLDALRVARAFAVIGASYGGMVALALAERFPERIERLVVISAAHEPHPMSTALRSLQRRIVGLGIDTGETREALTLARGLAMTTYRSAREFATRFDSQPLECTSNDAIFPVEGYLRHHGERFAAAWAPERFLALSLSADLHRVDPSRIRAPALLVAAEGDTIVPGDQIRVLAARLAGPSRLVEVPTTCGHDAFLAEPDAIGRLVKNSLTASRLS